MNTEHPRAMLVNVGGATTPAIHTLNERQPGFICFFVSPDSKPLIKDVILPGLIYQPEHYYWIETPAPQSLLECFRILADELPQVLRKWGVTLDELGVEYTAGTKPMSVAAVLATIDHSSQYFYVGSVDTHGRDRGGIGIVLDRQEFTWFQTNPWEELAVRDRQEIALLFNLGRFADAKERSERLANVVPEEMKKIYLSLADLIEGYALWDRFDYKIAHQMIFKALNSLKLFVAGRDDPLHATLNMVEHNADFLMHLNEKGEEAKRLDILDLLANAERRAGNAKKYDDATARLYSALEALARNRLQYQYKINNDRVKPDQVPITIREEFQRLYADQESPKGELKLSLKASYRLLAELGDELGQRYLESEAELSGVLSVRNKSRLAHGTDPVRFGTYQKLREITLSFVGVCESDLPRFPEMKL